MTLSSTTPREIKNGNGTATVFSFTFVINQATDLVVTYVDSSNNETVLTEGTGTTNYSVSVSSYPGTGSVTYPAALGTELATGEQLIIQRVVDLDQDTDLINQGAWKPEQVENTFDYSRMIDLQQQDELNRSIKSPASTPLGTTYTLPAPESLALFRWNEAATDLEAVQTADLVTTANFSNFKTDTFVDGVDFTAGTTTQVTLDSAPGTISNTQVYFDGVYQAKSNYSLAASVLTFDVAIPLGVATVEVVHGKAADVLAGSTREIQQGDDTTTVFTLANSYEPGNGTLHVYINGVRQEVGYGYTETNATTVTFDAPPLTGDIVLFLINPFSTQTTIDASNVTYTAAVTGASARNVQARLSERVSVKDFGAVGDGVTDDTAAIQAAIDAVEAAGGGIVHIPVGTYIVSSPLLVQLYGVTLQGEGWAVDEPFSTSVAVYGSVIKLADGAFNDPGDDGAGIIHFDYGGGGTQAKVGFRIKELAVFGNRSTDTLSPENSGTYNNNNTYGHGIRIEGARNVFLHDVFTGWCAQSGVRTETGGAIGFSPGGEFYGVTSLSNGTHGMEHTGGDTLISNCNTGFNGQDGIAWNSSGSINGAHCWDNFSDGLVLLAQTDVSVSGGYYYDNQRGGIVVGNVQRFTITGAVCQDNGKDQTETATRRAGIVVTDSGADGLIVGCVSSNLDESTVTGQQYGIRVESGASVKIASCKECPSGGSANGVSFISHANEWEEVTISSGAISVNGNKHKVAGEGGVADDLTTINGQTGDDYLILRASDSAVTITVKNATGNIFLSGSDFAMTHGGDMLMLTRIDSNYYEISRSDNAV